MSSHKRIGIGLLIVGLAGIAGCGVQDPTQPPVGSISVGARKENTLPIPTPDKTKAGATDRK
jgi:hypothetical protein